MGTISKTESIDGHEYEVTQLTAKRAVRFALRLSKIFGPVLFPILKAALGAAGAAGGEGSKPGKVNLGEILGNMNIDSLGPAVENFFDRCSEQDLDYLQSELLSNALMDGKPLWPQYDLAMQGQLTTIFKLLWFAMRVQFENFSQGPQENLTARMTTRTEQLDAAFR